MNAPLVPETLLPREGAPAQSPLPLASDGVQRWIWEGRYGEMLIEVVGDQVRVNGEPVEPFGR